MPPQNLSNSPAEQPEPAPTPPRPYVPPAPAPGAAPPPRPDPKQTAEGWAKDEENAYEAAGDKRSARTVGLWLAVCQTAPICGWKEGEMLTRGEYEQGMAKAKSHVPAEHGRSR
jgi:hypothetical protein